MKTEIIVAGAVALAGIMLLGGKSDGGGAGGGTGAGEAVEDALESAGVTINIPDFSFPTGGMIEMPIKEFAEIPSFTQKEISELEFLPGEALITDAIAPMLKKQQITATVPKPKMFTLPFIGATGATSFTDYIKTHNIYGKKIAAKAATSTSRGSISRYRSEGMSPAQAQHVQMLRGRFGQ